MLQRAVVLSVMLVLFGVAAAGAWVLVGSTLRSAPSSASGRAVDLGGVEVRVLPEWASAAPSDAGLDGLTGRVLTWVRRPLEAGRGRTCGGRPPDRESMSRDCRTRRPPGSSCR